ncbi:MAG TPA: protein-methionine-sulfoxide reductase heme-binding subunit MsrQ [Stellaceae bacterium]|nr:protein-methionine-sulfoxide reductase heme-binding subunit MsrQ [Stellaceae bacterium]
MFPWIDYRGRFSPLRACVFAALFAPAIYVALGLEFNWLGSRPLTEAIHQLGLWTIRFICIALAISPARKLLDWPRLIEVRRMVGVAACFYVLAHLLFYTIDEGWALGTVASEIVYRIYLTIGFTALVGLVVLASTSTDGMVRRLGRRWQKLHRVVYLIAVLACVHYFIQSKADVWEPLWIAGFFVWLMGWRALDHFAPRGRQVPLWQLALWCVGAAAITGFGEAIYYVVSLGAPFAAFIGANFSTDAGVRPSWIVLGVSLAVILVAAVRRFTGPRAASPARSRASAVRGA